MATINFYLDKPDKKGFAPIHLRINCNGSQVKLSTGQKIEPKKFNKTSQRATGISVESRETNHYLDFLKERADERRRKMKDFNYKFNTAKIDEIEKEPAYKRQGVNLDDAQHSSETSASRTSVSSDENDDIQLRSNNSFLHDNVD